MSEIIPAEQALDRAVSVLSAGGLAAIPTETVYGLAADATNGEAVARIYEAKGRPSFNPLIAHVGDVASAARIADFDPLAIKLAEAFWPGPLTLVLPRLDGSPVHDLATAGLDSIAVRMPAGFGGELARRFGRPIAAPSANLSGRVSATSAQHVARDLGDRIDLIVDGGHTPVGLESTIIKIEHRGQRAPALALLRPGGLAVEEIEAVAGMRVERAASPGIQAPGQLESHYAPDAGMRLNARAVEKGEALLAFGPDRIDNAADAAAIANLSPSGNLREAAANLFAMMLELDRVGARTIAVEPIPEQGLGEAINDRLRRAAAPRPDGAGG